MDWQVLIKNMKDPHGITRGRGITKWDNTLIYFTFALLPCVPIGELSGVINATSEQHMLYRDNKELRPTHQLQNAVDLNTFD